MADPQVEGGFRNQTFPPLPQEGGVPAVTSGEQGLGAESTQWQKLVGIVKQTSMNSPVGFYPGYEGSWLRGVLQSSIEKGYDEAGFDRLTPEEANRRYPGLPVPFDKPVYNDLAKLYWNDHQRRMDLQGVISRGPNSPALDFLAGFSGNLDPANLAIIAATGGIGRAAGIAPTIRNVFLQNAAMIGAAEIPTYFQTRAEHQVVNPYDTAKQVFQGAALGTGIHFFAAKMGARIDQYLEGLSDQQRRQQFGTALAQVELGGDINLGPQAMETYLRRSGAVQGSGPVPTEFRPLEHPGDAPAYAASSPVDGAPVQLEPLGQGLHVTDNAQVANNLSASPESGNASEVATFQIPKETRFLNLDTPVSDSKAGSFVAEIEKDLGVKVGFDSGVPLREAIKAIAAQAQVPSEALQKIQEIAKAQGFDGYRYTNQGVDGAPRSNDALLFDQTKAGNPLELNRADPNTVPRVPPDIRDAQADQATLSQSSRLADPEVDRALQSATRQLAEKPGVLDPVAQYKFEQAQKTLQGLAKEDAVVKQDLEALKKLKAMDAQESQAAKDLGDCMTRNLL